MDPASGEVECEIEVENDGITTFAVYDTKDAALRRAEAQGNSRPSITDIPCLVL